MKKIVRLGTAKTYNGQVYSIYCKIELSEGRLSISGVEGPTQGGNCIGACGQIDMHLRETEHTIELAPTWTRAQLHRFFETWERWHLNDVKAGSPAQEQYLRDHPLDPETYKYPNSYYAVASAYLKEAGLNPDNGYLYGSAWKTETIPQDVIEFLESLPTTDQQPAWV